MPDSAQNKLLARPGLLLLRTSVLVLLLCIATQLSAQRTPYNHRPIKHNFLRGNDSFFLQDTLPNKTRLGVVLGTSIGGYAIAYAGMAYAWYRNFPRTKFHFFNDNHEWQQVDKVGHFLGGYQGARGMIGMLKWGGMDRKKTALYGGLMGFLAMAPLEILDGYAEKWGASWGDLIADFGGGALAFGNEILWSEQRIQVKISYHPTGYADARPDLFGDKFTKYLKDYNGHTGWLSFRIHSFLPESKFKEKYPRWLNLAVGYGANGLLGGYDHGITPAIAAREYRQYYLSLDWDLSAIPTRSGGLRFVLDLLNFIHLPAPTLQYSSRHGFRWHWLYM